MNDKLRVKLWHAINEYTRSCGGDTSSGTAGRVWRMESVAALERVITEIESAAVRRAMEPINEALNTGSGVYKP